jgi:hypothetical protein
MHALQAQPALRVVVIGAPFRRVAPELPLDVAHGAADVEPPFIGLPDLAQLQQLITPIDPGAHVLHA